MKKLLLIMVFLCVISGCTPKKLDPPTIVLASEGLITWDMDRNATHYIVRVNDHEEKIVFNTPIKKSPTSFR